MVSFEEDRMAELMVSIVLNKRRKTTREEQNKIEQLLLIFRTKSSQAIRPLIQPTDALSVPSFLVPFHYCLIMLMKYIVMKVRRAGFPLS
jgi:hypothetical protein